MSSTRQVIEGLYDAVKRGDQAAFASLISDDIVVEEPRFLPYGGTYRGKAGIAEATSRALAMLDVSTLAINHYLVDGDRAFAVMTTKMRDNDEKFVIAEEARVENGKIVFLRIFVFDGGSMVPAR